MKKTVSVLLCVVMLCALLRGFTVSAGAASSGKCGDTMEWSLSADGTLTISGSGQMDDFDETNDDPAPWYEERDKITAAVVKEGVRSIGTYAFDGCQKLRTVTLADTVTTVGMGAFWNCLSVENVVLPPEVTVIEAETFVNCRHLTDLTVPDGLRAVRQFAFLNCTSLRVFSVPDRLTEFDPLAFSGCLRLHRFDVSEQNPVYASDENGVVFNREKTTLVRYPGGRQAETYTVPEGVTAIAPYAFMCSPFLTEVTLPSSVATIGAYAFYCCAGLRYPAVNDTITEIAEGTYRSCDSLSEIVIPDGVKTIGEGAFMYSDRIRSVTLGASVESVGASAFYDAERLSYLYLPKSVRSVGEKAFGKSNLKTALYAGTKEDWGRIAFGDGNDPLLAAQLRYQAKPAEMKQLKQTLYLTGDVTGDLKVTSEDARLALRASVRLEHYEEGSREYLSADANKDGTLGADDARLILRASVGLEKFDDEGKKLYRLLGFSNLLDSPGYLTEPSYDSEPAVFDAPYDEFIKTHHLPEDAVVIGLLDPEGSLIDTEARIGDIIVSVNGKPFSEIGSFVANGKAGDRVTLGLVRILEDGTMYELEATGTVMLSED